MLRGSGFDVERHGPVLVLRAHGPELRSGGAASLIAAALGPPAAAPANVVLDLTAVSKVDSAVLGAIAQLNAEHRLRVVGLAPLIESVLGILGILPTLVVEASAEAAVAGLMDPGLSGRAPPSAGSRAGSCDALPEAS